MKIRPRRELIRRFGTALALGVFSGGVADYDAKKLGVPENKARSIGLGTLFGMSTLSAVATLLIQERGKEFRVDLGAAGILGIDECIYAIYELLPQQEKEKDQAARKEFFRIKREEFAAVGVEISDENLECLFRISLADQPCEPEFPIPLPDILKGYPRPRERMCRLAKERSSQEKNR